jgi:hypothetical protein
MACGSADRYFQAEVTEPLKLEPEGVEGRVPFKAGARAMCVTSPSPRNAELPVRELNQQLIPTGSRAG